jgi:prepilin-type processing-associated H-X9-DG protein
LKQIGLALHGHHDVYQVFPSNGGWDGKQKYQAAGGQWIVAWTKEFFTYQTFNYGVGEPGMSPDDQPGSWAYAILPWLEQEAIFQQRDWQIGVSLFYCPARRPPQALPAVNDAYGHYNSGGWNWGRTDYAANKDAIENRPTCRNISAFTDGTSSTILIGEKSMNPKDYVTGTWYWDEPYFLGGSGGTQRWGLVNLRDTPGMGLAFRYNWGSAHPSAANFLFGDGSVRPLAYELSPIVISALLTINAGEVVPDF